MDPNVLHVDTTVGGMWHGCVTVEEQASDTFTRFRAAVLDDESLQERLRVISDWQTFSAEAIAAAAELGIRLTPDELDDAQRHAQRAWRDRWV
jgi:hypothetical protein